MKKLLLFTALLFTATLTTTAKDKNPKTKISKELTKPHKFYTAIIDEEGKTIKNPTNKEYYRTFVKYLLNNTWESNVYRWEFQHIMKNWKPKTTTTASDKTGHILTDSEKLIEKNFFYFT